MRPRLSTDTTRSFTSQQGSGSGISLDTVTEAPPPEAPPTEEEIFKKPWKFIGYRGYANFISSEDDFFILRRFNTLNARVALALQDELCELEEELSELDTEFSKRCYDGVSNGTFREDQVEERRALVREIAKKLGKYSGLSSFHVRCFMRLIILDEFVLQQSSLRKYPQAPSRDVKSIQNWHYNYDYRAIAAEEQKYLDHKKDLISVVERDKAPLRRLIDKSQRLRTLSIWKRKGKDPADYDFQHVSYYSDKRIDGFASGVIVGVGVVMLITPIWILQEMKTLQTKLAVITIFVFAFLLILSFPMASKPFEALGATAA
ncbi:hypothetical protein G7Z17_g52 [Cylindrodendrum hubeiense]|uniref:DUF6594 domain-containing protein n=1 Tax=Cylindrodendrum hubeiense TaxID=595255 RepID=A0A9P5LMP2_9HYPO|nr:hypothetical protein G7Z17_g52 [Cylindrodendrum hubeiense]